MNHFNLKLFAVAFSFKTKEKESGCAKLWQRELTY